MPKSKNNWSHHHHHHCDLADDSKATTYAPARNKIRISVCSPPQNQTKGEKSSGKLQGPVSCPVFDSRKFEGRFSRVMKKVLIIHLLLFMSTDGEPAAA